MLSQYSEEVKNFLDRSERIARLYGSDLLNTDHLLLGLLEEDSLARKIIRSLSRDDAGLKTKLCQKLDKTTECRELNDSVIVTMVPRARRVLDFAEEEAKSMGRDRVGTESVLLGMLRDETSSAAQLLNNAEIVYASARIAALQYYSSSSSQ